MKRFINTVLFTLVVSPIALAQFPQQQQQGFTQQQSGMMPAPNAPQGSMQMQGGGMMGVQSMPGQMGELPSGGETTALNCGVHRMASTGLRPGSVPMGAGSGSHLQ